jgi:hypothetical protein
MTHTVASSAVLCAAAIMMTACDSTRERPRINPAQPTTLEPQTPPPALESLLVRDAPPTPIALGHIVGDEITTSDPACTIVFNRWPVPCRHFLMTAPASGTLVVTLTWDVEETDMILMLRIGETDFWNPGRPYSPHVARVKIGAGERTLP